MTRISRRSFLHTTGLTPFAIGAARWGNLHAQGPLTRPEARTADGIAMLRKYAKAVGILKDTTQTPVGKPSSWTFQWYTHSTPKPKADALNEVYPAGQHPEWKAVAVQTWSTCQAHFGPASREPYFLPWHRVYLFYFESIIRAVLSDQTFALPYWDYAKDPTLPLQFIKGAEEAFKPLFHENRGTGINDGDPVDDVAAIRKTAHDALCQGRYTFTSQAKPGFCTHLDFNLHGDIHGDVGGDMGSVPTAAQDPIFWLHHCNIDRLWASWVAAGGKNPTDATFLNEPFTFADVADAAATKKAVDALETTALGYKYDQLEPKPPDCPPAAQEAVPVITYRAPNPVTLGAGVARVALQPAQPQGARETAGGRKYLVVNALKVTGRPSTVYDVYLNLPDGATETDRKSRRIGQINFFDLVPHAEHPVRSDKFFTYDVTDALRAPGSAAPVVAIEPRRQASGDAKVEVGDIHLVSA